MNLIECEDAVLEFFRQNGFQISEWPNIHPSLEWRPRIRVTRTVRGNTSDAAIIIRENGTSYGDSCNWNPLVEARRQLPNLSIYFAIPDDVRSEPLLTELQSLGVGLYLIKPDGTLDRVQNDRVPFEDALITYPITPRMPYRNRVNMYKVFSICNGYLWWLDKHFMIGGFNLLEDWCQCEHPNVNAIRILGSTRVGTRELGRLRRNFPPLQTELAAMGITAEMKLVDNPTILRTLHDRYIIADNIVFNIPPVGSIISGQHGSLKLDDNPPDFNTFWASSINL